MTTFIIPAELFMRLAPIAPQPGEFESRDWLRCVRIEHQNGKAVAIASNGRLLAGEYIQDVSEPDGAVCITIVPEMLEFARIAAQLQENLIVAQAPGWTVVTSTGGQMYPANGEVDGSAWVDWRALLPADLPTKNNGCFSFTGERMARLCASAPSKAIRCAKFIDSTVPTLVRDLTDPNWFGVFMVSELNGQQNYEPATIPEFLRK